MPRGESAPSSASTGIGKHCGGSNVAEEIVMDEEQASWFVGVDWASQTHHVVLIDACGRKVAERGFSHGGEGMADMFAWIGKHTGVPPAAVPVAIEVPHGPVVEGLMERGFPVNDGAIPGQTGGVKVGHGDGGCDARRGPIGPLRASAPLVEDQVAEISPVSGSTASSVAWFCSALLSEAEGWLRLVDCLSR